MYFPIPRIPLPVRTWATDWRSELPASAACCQAQGFQDSGRRGLQDSGTRHSLPALPTLHFILQLSSVACMLIHGRVCWCVRAYKIVLYLLLLELFSWLSSASVSPSPTIFSAGGAQKCCRNFFACIVFDCSALAGHPTSSRSPSCNSRPARLPVSCFYGFYFA